MKLSLIVDRFEGDTKTIAVLVTDDDEHTINWPRALLPRDTRAGDVLTIQLDRDTEATQQVARQTKAVQDELKRRDPGGDIKL